MCSVNRINFESPVSIIRHCVVGVYRTEAITVCFYPGKSCRFKVVKWLRRRYKDPKAAENALFPMRSVGTQTDFSEKSIGTQTNIEPRSLYVETGPKQPLANYPEVVQQTVISDMSQKFSDHCKTALQLDVPVDFLTYASSAMIRLKKHRRSNVVYNLAKGIGEERSGVDESRLPVSRMPMGLIEHITNFFTAEDINEVRLFLNDNIITHELHYFLVV